MQHLLIVCHPKRQSFTQTIARTYANALDALGHEVVVRDLYRAHFDPLLGEGELIGAAKPVIPSAVRREQRRLLAAGAIAFFYPLWWAYMPAMIKGYIDRVLSVGVAYDLQDAEMVPRLSGKKALIFTSSGADMAYLRRSKQWRAMRTLEEDHILSLCGITLLDHVHFASIAPDLPKPSLEKHLAVVRDTVQTHWGNVPAARG
jgi:NAD(P)H dehydrogenase (quinone)